MDSDLPLDDPNPPLLVLIAIGVPITAAVAITEVALTIAEIEMAPIAAAMPAVGVPLELILVGTSAAVLDFEIAYVTYVYRVATNPDEKQSLELFPPWGFGNGDQ